MHDHGRGAVDRDTQRRALRVALWANAALLAAEVAGGLAFRSLALLADAGHLLSDVAALAIALVAQRLIDRPATSKHSYGLQRAEVLGAQTNGVVLAAVAIAIAVTAVNRLDQPADVVGGGLLAVAVIGLAVNAGSAWYVGRAQGDSLNMRGASLHLISDAAGSVAAVVAGVAVLVWNADWVDPLVSLAMSVLIVWAAWRLLRDTAHVLLEGTPRGMRPADVEAALLADPEVEAVHHVHLWNLASDVPALSAHVVLRGEQSLHDAQAHGDRLKAMLVHDFAIDHATLELECHPCDPIDTHGGRV